MYMQRILFILTVAMLSLFAGEAYAQRDLPGQTGVQFTTGGVNHFLSWKSGGERHYFTSLAFTHTNRNRTCWLVIVSFTGILGPIVKHPFLTAPGTFPDDHRTGRGLGKAQHARYYV